MSESIEEKPSPATGASLPTDPEVASAGQLELESQQEVVKGDDYPSSVEIPMAVASITSSLSGPFILYALRYSKSHPRGTIALPILEAIMFCGALLMPAIAVAGGLEPRTAWWKTMLITLYLYGVAIGLVFVGADTQHKYNVLG